jgi:MFS family permease
VQAKVASELNAVAGSPLAAVAVPTVAAGRADLLHRTAYGVLVVDAVGSVDRLLEASASGVSAATAMTDVMQRVEAHVHRAVVVDDIRPPLLGDHNSLTSFYLVIGWIIGGYLAAAMLGVSSGSRPANVNRATVRLSAMAIYAVVTGLLGAVIVGPWLHSLPDHLLGLWLLGSLLIFCTGAFTIGLQVIAGTVGIGIAILIFVVLGNPSAGGAYTWQLLPEFWRVIGPWIPNGVGTSAARGIAYFGSTGVTTDYLVIIGYGVAGMIATYGVLFWVGHQLVHLVGDDEGSDDERLSR